MQFDLLVRNGTVIDPGSHLHAQRDVAIKDGKIAVVDAAIPEGNASSTIDASGLYVAPGFVDLHAHIFSGVGYWGIDADSLAWQTGVTTWVDAGSAGGYTFPAFRDMAARAETVSIRSFLNVSYLGLIGLNYDELCNLETCDVAVARRVIERNRDLIVGVKVRLGAGRVGVGGLEPLRRARQIADDTDGRVMVHIGAEPPTLEDALHYLRRGDIITHSYTGASMRLLDEHGHVRDCVKRARDRGILFDIGHGSGSFAFASGDALASAQFWPDTISTDMHHVSLHGPNIVDPLAIQTVVDVRGDGSPGLSLPLVMSKLMYLGMSLDDVITAVTSASARAAGVDDRVGAIRPGMAADLVAFRVENAPVTFFDIYGARREANQAIRVSTTIKNGIELSARPGPAVPPWIRLVDAELGGTPTRDRAT